MPEWLPFATLAVAMLALLVAIATYHRNGDWEKSKAGEATRAEIGGLKSRVTVIETKIEDLATKADIATLTSEVDAVQDKVSLVYASTHRIEGFLMERSK